MRFEYLSGQNYRSWKGLDLPMTGFGRIWTVSGHNGAGKTTMAEGWAVLLYETGPSKGKGIAKYISNVPSWGDKEVLADLRKHKKLPVLKMEGILVHAGFRYRVVRTFDPNLKQGNHMLALMRKPADHEGGWEESDGVSVLNGQTIPETQELIEKMFGNYRAFITSTFMSGGVSGFLDSTDEDREEAAAYLFGCQGYDARQQKATDRRLALERVLDIQAETLSRLAEKAGKEKDFELQFNGMGGQLTELNSDLLVLEAEINDLRDRKEKVLDDIARADAARRAADQATSRIGDLEKQVKDLETLKASQGEIKAKVVKLKAVRGIIQDQQKKCGEASDIRHEIVRANEKIISEKLRLESGISLNQKRVDVLNLNVNKIDANRARIKEIETKVKGFGDLEKELGEKRAALDLAIGKESALRAMTLSNAGDLSKLDHSISLLTAANVCCPTCHKEFQSQGEKDAVVNQFSAEILQIEKHNKVLYVQLDELVDEKAILNNAITGIGLRMKDRALLESEKVKIGQSLVQAEVDENELNELQAGIDAVREIIVGDEYAEAERGKVIELQSQIEKVGFDQDVFTRAQQDERDLAYVEGAVARLEKVDEDRERLVKQIGNEQNDLAELMTLAGRAQGSRKEVEKIVEDLARMGEDLKTKQTARESARGGQMLAQAGLEEALAAKKEIKDIHEGQDHQRKKVAVLKVLEVAFSPKGIPNMKYSRYLPALSNKVNYALSVISPGWQVNIMSQISNRGKFVIPIEVTSPEGLTDSYSALSGGERFIVALSFQIGQGLFMGERTGAKPELIMIDEGFGVLDPQNTEKVKAAISATAQNFGQVAIISHIPELQSMGQVQLTVYKSAKDGSMYEMAGAGTGLRSRVSKRFWFEEDQLAAINAGTSIVKDAIPGMTDERVLEFGVANLAQNVQGDKTKEKARRKIK